MKAAVYIALIAIAIVAARSRFSHLDRGLGQDELSSVGLVPDTFRHRSDHNTGTVG
jgi:hypothetical protein